MYIRYTYIIIYDFMMCHFLLNESIIFNYLHVINITFVMTLMRLTNVMINGHLVLSIIKFANRGHFCSVTII